MRKRIAIDMDETIVDTLSRHLDWYNREFSQSLCKADLHATKIYDRVLVEHVARVRTYPDDPDFFANIPPYENAISVIKDLNEHYDIYIATAAMEHPASFGAKYTWLVENLPFLSPMNFIFCGSKSILNTDYLIDDSPRHFTHFAGEGILFSAPHNANETGFRRVENWQEVRAMFL